MQMMSTAAASTLHSAETHANSSVSISDRVLGVLLMAVLPALFWTGLIAAMAPVLGYALSAATLLKVGTGIGMFLACVCCAVTGRRT